VPDLVAELARRQIAVFAIGGNAAALAAKATTTIPIVFIVNEDPVRLGLVASLAKPGGSLTGVNFLAGKLTAKRLGLLREFVPTATRVAVTRHALPASYGSREHAEIGGLMSYGPSLFDGFRQLGAYAGRVLNGTKPADLPVVQSSKFELIINHQTARMLGLTVPPSLLTTADEVIE
jgi:ABC-type uncharacterized transport system substrate-binding protein